MSSSQKMALSIVCGGQSTEHEISIHSARNVAAALDVQRYQISVVYIDPQGFWHWVEDVAAFVNQGPRALLEQKKTDSITVIFGDNTHIWQSRTHSERRYSADCIFPLVHGTQGEDGAVQGLFDLLRVPYVGADVQSSVLCIEKDIMKRLLFAAKIPTADWHTVYSADPLKGLYQRLARRFRQRALFIKPVSLGSSVGAFPVSTEAEFHAAVEQAFRFDDRVLIEPHIDGREIECSVLGNGNPKASLLGEIIPNADYYSYESKYSPGGMRLVAPAHVSSLLTDRIQRIALSTFKAFHCSGMARIDFFLVDNKKILVNELNTIPGFTQNSIYPKLWAIGGLSFRDLLDELIALALARHRDQAKLMRCYPDHQ